MDLASLFKKKEILPLKKGDSLVESQRFGSRSDVSYRIYCFITLTCEHCIDLLPQINDFIRSDQGEFILCIVAKSEDIREIVEYFDFGFSTIQVSSERLRNQFMVPQTPFAYIVDSDYKVLAGRVIYNSADLEYLVFETHSPRT